MTHPGGLSENAISLPFPHKVLWPNGRGHWAAVSREKKKHREWARLAMLEVLPPCFRARAGVRLRLNATFYPKTRHAIDKDNASASLKAYQDGIADALGIDDSLFDEPRITFGDPVRGGCVRVTVES